MVPDARLQLTPAARSALRDAWASAAEAEPCGYLLGREDVVERVVPGRNVHARPAFAFRLAPEEQLVVRRAARSDGLEVIGIWHGHRCGAARPSRADVKGHGVLAPPWMLIAGRGADGGFEWRAWLRRPRASSPASSCP